eukprot:COSAG01_NODE_16002_length_1279_cov_1.807627_1_plen_28_part_10
MKNVRRLTFGAAATQKDEPPFVPDVPTT